MVKIGVITADDNDDGHAKPDYTPEDDGPDTIDGEEGGGDVTESVHEFTII
jgi:hypothetical protein